MNQHLCPQTYRLIEKTVQICQRRRPLHLFDPKNLRQKLTHHVLKAQRSYTGPTVSWFDHCRTILNKTLRRMRVTQGRRRPQNKNSQPDNLSQRDTVLDNTLTRILGRLQKHQNRWKKDHIGQALLQAARDPNATELIAQVPTYDQIFALMLAALTKDQILQETGLSENAYTTRLSRVATALKNKFPHLARGRHHRTPKRPAPQTTPSDTPKTATNQKPTSTPQPATQPNPQTTKPEQNPTELQQKRIKPEPTQPNPEQIPTERQQKRINPEPTQPKPEQIPTGLQQKGIKPEQTRPNPEQIPTELQQKRSLLAKTIALFTKLWRR